MKEVWLIKYLLHHHQYYSSHLKSKMDWIPDMVDWMTGISSIYGYCAVCDFVLCV